MIWVCETSEPSRLVKPVNLANNSEPSEKRKVVYIYIYIYKVVYIYTGQFSRECETLKDAVSASALATVVPTQLIKILGRVHKKGAQKGCTKRVHKKVAQNGCTKWMHKRGQQNSKKYQKMLLATVPPTQLIKILPILFSN